MPKIEFSHKYLKLKYVENGDKALLCGVFKVNLEDLPNFFVAYDTVYVDGMKTKHYPLPRKGKYLLLLFLYCQIDPAGEPVYSTSILFTTLRKWTPKKEEYYKSKIGEFFEVVVRNENI